MIAVVASDELRRELVTGCTGSRYEQFVSRHLPRRSSKNSDLQFANSDRFKKNYSIDVKTCYKQTNNKLDPEGGCGVTMPRKCKRLSNLPQTYQLVLIVYTN